MDRRGTLISEAIGIVRKAGYAGFSYADLSEAVGIRKASIHHHFPGKGDLGLAMVETYRQTFVHQLAEIEQSSQTCGERLRHYADLYRTAWVDDGGCLCGVLAAEFAGLPRPVQKAVRGFFNDNIAWLETVLRDGETRDNDGEASTRQIAQMFLATLQGALLSARVQDDIGIFDAAAHAAIAMIRS
jgi:TetR/AcrR family transcriptional repressor of nem operon